MPPRNYFRLKSTRGKKQIKATVRLLRIPGCDKCLLSERANTGDTRWCCKLIEELHWAGPGVLPDHCPLLEKPIMLMPTPLGLH